MPHTRRISPRCSIAGLRSKLPLKVSAIAQAQYTAAAPMIARSVTMAALATGRHRSAARSSRRMAATAITLAIATAKSQHEGLG